MRIVIDMQGAQTASRFRGIGRYTLAFAQAVVRNRGQHEIVLALSGLFPDTIEPIRAAFNYLLPEKNIRVWRAPGPVKECELGNESRRVNAELIREAFIASLQPDVIHICSLFEGYVDDAVTSIGRFDTQSPVSVTLHDLIPLRNKDHFLKPNPLYERNYLRKLEWLGNATVYLAVSEHAKKEGQQYLRSPENCFFNTLEAVESHFSPQQISDELAQQLRNKFGITRAFVFYTGGFDEHKNLSRLINAYAGLSKKIRTAHQLVFGGKNPQGAITDYKYLAKNAGLGDEELVFTDYVTDEELVQLYNLCALYVFPSWHEGFGLPALEAMACGAPVIGANSTSLPEVIGLPEALFNPFSTQDISAKLTQALEDEDFQKRLSVHGLEQAKKFSWDESAQRAIKAWEKLPSRIVQKQGPWRQITEQIDSSYQRLISSIASTERGSSKITDSDLRSIAKCIANNQLELDGFLRPIALSEKLTWRIEGPFDSNYSLAMVNREIARALAQLGHRIVLHSTEGPGDFSPNAAFLLQNPDLAAMHLASEDIASIDADIVSRNLYPPRVEDMVARFNFLHAYGWEESAFPLDWVDSFNKSLQGMSVISDHVCKIMLDNGVTVPIAVSSLGADHWTRIIPDNTYKLTARSFRFLHVSSCFPRKGVDVMLKAYGRAFRASDDVSLVIKTFPNPHNQIYRWLKEAQDGNSAFPHVLIIEDDFTGAQLKALYSQCHALVAPSRAEGFGLPMAEAMQSGLAVITTGWGGQTGFCTAETSWLVDYSFARAKTHFGLSASVWAEPDEIHLATLMGEVFHAPPDVRHTRIASGQRLLNENFKWVDVAQRMVDAAHICVQKKQHKDLRIGWVATWNTRCGIATYSEHLINNLPTDITILAAHSDSGMNGDSANVCRCWSAGDHDDLTALMHSIDKHRLDVLVIQFNYGFFNFDVFKKFLDTQIELGRIVVITLHATTDPAHVPKKKLSTLVSTLRRCHRLLVHSPSDMNKLKRLGLVDNVTLFPHGVVDYSSPVKMPFDSKRSFRIASYGFFLPHKGLLELIDATALLRNRDLNIQLDMVNSAYPVPESVNLIAQVTKKIENSGLQGMVSICSDFLNDLESLERLANADLIIFPYQDTGESASGAVRYGIASGRPVAATPIGIFEDVENVVHYLPGQSAESIADGVASLMTKILTNDRLISEKEESAQRWRHEHSYSRIGLRLYGMLYGLSINMDNFKE